MYNYFWREKCHVYLVVLYILSPCILHPAPNLSTMLCHGKFQIWKFGPETNSTAYVLSGFNSTCIDFSWSTDLMPSHPCGTFHILNGLQKIKGHDRERLAKFLQSTKTKCLIEVFKINTGWRMDNLFGSSTNPINWIVVKNKYRSVNRLCTRKQLCGYLTILNYFNTTDYKVNVMGTNIWFYVALIKQREDHNITSMIRVQTS